LARFRLLNVQVVRLRRLKLRRLDFTLDLKLDKSGRCHEKNERSRYESPLQDLPPQMQTAGVGTDRFLPAVLAAAA